MSSVSAIQTQARAKSGLQDLGGTDYQEGLEVLLRTYAQNQFHEAGLAKRHKRLVDLLAKRAEITAALQTHAAIAQERIVQPLYLTGLPRTGTSALLNLLACDSANRPMKLWEGLNPTPLLDAAGKPLPEAQDPRYQGMKAWEEKLRTTNPDFAKIHSTGADTAEECIHLLNHTFADVQYGVEVLLEPYGSWFQAQVARDGLLASYRYYADLLRMLQWQRPGVQPGWRWLLKSPAHLWALGSIHALFADACVVITHRAPVEAVASYCSMMAALLQDRDFDRSQFGVVVLEYLARSMECAMAARAQQAAGLRVLDVSYRAFMADSVATVRQMYDYFALPCTAATQAAWAAYALANPVNKHGKHRYDLASYGLTAAQVNDRFAAYLAQYGHYCQDA